MSETETLARMALDGDPYRILGLPSGAPLADVKRAYRRLAKEHHPDTAGDAAVSRFLAIQAAYEALVGSDGRGRRRPGVARQGPWQADADRARATRDGWQTRRGRAGTRPAGHGAPPGADGTSGTRRRRGATGSRITGDRPPDRATPGSTSYDFAEHEPLDPDWTGASWYGQSSGTYWTINPKEYADPRKHGPEYQARGRRRPTAGEPGTGGFGGEPDATGGEPLERDEPAGRHHARGRRAPAGGATAEPPEAVRGAAGATVPAAETPGTRAGASSTGAGASGTGVGRADVAGTTAGERPARADSFDAALAALASSPGLGGRLALALVGWPPIGVALAIALGEISGCGRFAASCVETFSVGSWLAQAAVIAVLLLLPSLAAIASSGSIAVLATAIPAAVVLSAVGGSRAPGAAAGVLLAILAVAWVVGVGVAVVRRSRRVGP